MTDDEKKENDEMKRWGFDDRIDRTFESWI